MLKVSENTATTRMNSTYLIDKQQTIRFWADQKDPEEEICYTMVHDHPCPLLSGCQRKTSYRYIYQQTSVTCYTLLKQLKLQKNVL